MIDNVLLLKKIFHDVSFLRFLNNYLTFSQGEQVMRNNTAHGTATVHIHTHNIRPCTHALSISSVVFWAD